MSYIYESSSLWNFVNYDEVQRNMEVTVQLESLDNPCRVHTFDSAVVTIDGIGGYTPIRHLGIHVSYGNNDFCPLELDRTLYKMMVLCPFSDDYLGGYTPVVINFISWKKCWPYSSVKVKYQLNTIEVVAF